MASGWLKRRTKNGRDETLFLYRDSTGTTKSRTIGSASMTNDEAWKKVGEEGYHLLVGAPNPDHISFADLRKAFVLDGRTESGKLKEHNTRHTDQRNCRLHLSHFDLRIAKDITSKQIRDWLYKKSAGLQHKLRSTLSAIYRYGRVEGLVPRDCNPVEDVGASAQTDYEAVVLEPADTFAILREIGDPLVNTLVLVLAVVALRASEVLGLRWGDIDWKKGKIRIVRKFADGAIGNPKSRASRSPVQMSKPLAAVFMEWRRQTLYAKDSDYIFPSYKLKGKKPRTESMIVQDYIRPAAEKLGLRPPDCKRFGLHNLRHSLATWLVESGIDPIVVVRMLRWSDAKMIHTYAHLDRMAKTVQGKFMAKLLGGKRVQKRVQQKRPSRRKDA